MSTRHSSDRREAITVARQYLEKRPIYLDTETTGIDRYSEIIEISLIDHDGQVVYQSMVKPIKPIPPSASRIHGITNSMVNEAPRWSAIWPEVEGLLSGRHVGIYNAEFDLRLMKQTHAFYGLVWPRSQSFIPFCIMKLYAQFQGLWDYRRGAYRWISLDKAGAQMQIPIPNSHRASDDALLARALLMSIASSK